MFSATDAASAAIDFSKSNVDDGVVDSPPSRGLRRSPIVSPSPLRGSQCRPRSDRSSSPTPRSSNTPHRQFYKQCADEAPLDAAVPVQVGCAIVAVSVQVDSMIRTFPVRDYPRLEDNLRTVCVDDGCEPHIASKVKHGTRGGQHRRPEGKVHLRRSFPSKVGSIVSPGFCRPCHSGGCFLVDAQVVLWSNLLRSRLLQDFRYGGWSCHVQFAMLVILSFVSIFLSVPLH